MPIHEYQCRACGARFEELTLSSADEAAVACRECQSRRVTRLFSAFAVGSSEPQPVAQSGSCGSCGVAQRNLCGVE
ncbi:MAG: zinc ribbon domain-containing protein [Deltaproteobacteria bacterium]|nr:zinc ribbon domain-containing protein [Deltaproteobacteria bacterium]